VLGIDAMLNTFGEVCCVSPHCRWKRQCPEEGIDVLDSPGIRRFVTTGYYYFGMTEQKATTRAALTDDETATVLAEALAGRRLSRRAARQLATSLQRVTGALPPGTGNLAGLTRRLTTAAELLDAQAAAPPRRRT